MVSVPGLVCFLMAWCCRVVLGSSQYDFVQKVGTWIVSSYPPHVASTHAPADCFFRGFGLNLDKPILTILPLLVPRSSFATHPDSLKCFLSLLLPTRVAHNKVHKRLRHQNILHQPTPKKPTTTLKPSVLCRNSCKVATKYQFFEFSLDSGCCAIKDKQSLHVA